MLQELAEQLSISFHHKVKHQPQGHARGRGHGALFKLQSPSHRITHAGTIEISRSDSPPNLRYIYMGECIWDCMGHVEGCVIPPVGRAGPNRAELLPSKAKPSQAEPGRAKPGQAEPSRAAMSRDEPTRGGVFFAVVPFSLFGIDLHIPVNVACRRGVARGGGLQPTEGKRL